MFDELDRDAIFRIIDIELAGFYKRVASLGYTLDITAAAKDFIAKKGYDPQFGARPLKRAIQKYLEDELAELIINASVTPWCKNLCGGMMSVRIKIVTEINAPDSVSDKDAEPADDDSTAP